MEGNWAASVMEILDKITKLIYINLLWFLFTLIGLGIFGLMPSTASVNLLVRKYLRREEYTNIFVEFWNCYKKSFISSNIIGLIFYVIAFILYLDFHILLGTNSVIGKVLLALTLMFGLIFVGVLLNFFPIYSKYHMKVFDYLKLSLVIALSNPLITLLMTLWVIIIIIICLKWSVVLPLLSVVLVAMGVNGLSMKKIETKHLFDKLSR